MAEPRIERVVVRLDAVSDSMAAITEAAGLAARWQATLQGLFVEDEALLRLAALPFAREVGATGASGGLGSLEDHVRLAGRAAERGLAAAAAPHRLAWSFDRVRRSMSQPLDGIAARDFLVMTVESRPFADHLRLPVAGALAAGLRHRPSLLLRGRRRDGARRVVALLGRGADTGHLLDAAATVAACRAAALTVLGRTEDAGDDALARWIAASPPGLSIRLETVSDAASMRRRLDELDCAVLALGADGPDALPAPLPDTGDYDLLLVR